MTDPLLCPRVTKSIPINQNFCNLNGIAMTNDEKFDFIRNYISLIDSETRYQPATRDFIERFNMSEATRILGSYTEADNFFSTMTHNQTHLNNLQNLTPPDVYFLLLELKLYLSERISIIIQNNCTETMALLEQYKNHFSFNPPITKKTEQNHSPLKHTHPVFFVPETPLYTSTGNSMSIDNAIYCITFLIDMIHAQNGTDADLSAYSFFINFRDMLFNNKHDHIQPDQIIHACNYVYELIPGSDRKICASDHVCLYALFTESLFELYRHLDANNGEL